MFEGLLCMVVHVISRLVTTGCGLLKAVCRMSSSHLLQDPCGLSVQRVCLAASKQSTDGESIRRWAHHAHMMILAELLGLKFTVHNLKADIFAIPAGDHRSELGVAFDLVLIGGHYDLLYR
ncbi:TPA: hypothetical protein ACH3X3_009987 [Trebouxia sp. C0006]